MIATAGQSVTFTVVKASADVEITAEPQVDWLTASGTTTDGLAATYTFTAGENTGAERVGAITFTEASTGLANTVSVTQQKAGTVI